MGLSDVLQNLAAALTFLCTYFSLCITGSYLYNRDGRISSVPMEKGPVKCLDRALTEIREASKTGVNTSFEEALEQKQKKTTTQQPTNPTAKSSLRFSPMTIQAFDFVPLTLIVGRETGACWAKTGACWGRVAIHDNSETLFAVLMISIWDWILKTPLAATTLTLSVLFWRTQSSFESTSFCCAVAVPQSHHIYQSAFCFLSL